MTVTLHRKHCPIHNVFLALFNTPTNGHAGGAHRYQLGYPLVPPEGLGADGAALAAAPCVDVGANVTVTQVEAGACVCVGGGDSQVQCPPKG